MTDFALNNSIRETLLKTGAPNAAHVLDALGIAGYNAGDEITVKQALQQCLSLGIAITDSAIRKGLKQARNIGLLATRKSNDGRRGAPSTIYRLAPVSLIAEKLEVVRGITDQLTRQAVAKLRDYRAHLSRALIARRPGKYGRKGRGERLGVSARTTYNYDKMFADIEITPQFIETPLSLDLFGIAKQREDLTLEDFNFIPAEAESGPVYLEIYREKPYTEAELAQIRQPIAPLWRDIATPTTYTEAIKVPYNRYLVYRELKAGRACTRVQQTANYYEVINQTDDWLTSVIEGEYAAFIHH